MAKRRFLFLQGPHGPFFRHLSRRLRSTGAETLKVGFNGGDAAFWRPHSGYFPYRGRTQDWPTFLAALLDHENVSDLVVYGDSRPLHATALGLARARGVRTHIFEEGYLRPYWITYERTGSNGASPLLDIPGSAIPPFDPEAERSERGSDWGELAQHVFYGAAYHAALLAGRPFYRGYKGHRGVPVTREAAANLARFLTLPAHAAERRIATARLSRGGYPYHLGLLQLGHDENFRAHSPFSGMVDFIEDVVAGFARGAPGHHHLVFKAHPLEDGRTKLKQAIRRSADKQGIGGRVHFLRGGKLAGLLDDALSAVTVNSTAGQQVLRRGIPLKAMGRAVYSGRGFTSDQPLDEFFADPQPPDLIAYRAFRRFLLSTCQIPGGYYSARGRATALRYALDMILSPLDPYGKALSGAAVAQHLRLVR